MKNFRDIEQLSLYLDGRLGPAESARLESRLASDHELASTFNDLRAARGILRKLPARKSPRNFTLTRQMVGLKPPLPRSYSFFRFSTAFATILLTLTFAANALSGVPLIGNLYGGGYGRGGGGGGAAESAAAPAPAAEEPYGIGGGPAATEAPAAMEQALPTTATAEAPALEMAPLPTLTADSVATEVPTAKQAATPSELMDQPPAENQAATELAPQEQPRSQSQALVPFAWQVVLFVLILLSGLAAFLLRRSAIQKWK
jgi:hypothetical protein